MATRLRAELDGIAASVAGLPRPRVLVVVGREPGSGRVGTLWAAGADTFYNDIIEFAGGANAIAEGAIRYPELSVEGLLAIDPDVILDVLADSGARDLSAGVAAADWRTLGDLRAGRDGRIHVVMDDYVVVPGPRVTDTVRLFAGYLHSGAGR
jgi:iron complex transport system substrate-binding protein